MKSKAWSWFLAPVAVLSVGSAWNEVFDVNNDTVVGPHEALEVARLWR